MSPFPGHVSIVSRVDHVLSKENMDEDRACADQKIAAVICSTSCISHLWYATERDRVQKNRYDESGIDTSSNSGARGWTSFKRNIIYAIRSIKINGVEINRSVCIHAQTARRCRTRRVHSSIRAQYGIDLPGSLHRNKIPAILGRYPLLGFFCRLNIVPLDRDNGTSNSSNTDVVEKVNFLVAASKHGGTSVAEGSP